MKNIEDLGDQILKSTLSRFKSYNLDHKERYSFNILIELNLIQITMYYSQNQNNVWNFDFLLKYFDMTFTGIYKQITSQGGQLSSIYDSKINCIIDIELIKSDINNKYFLSCLEPVEKAIELFINNVKKNDNFFYNGVYNATIDKVAPSNDDEKQYFPPLSIGNWNIFMRKLYFARLCDDNSYNYILKLAYRSLSEFYINSIRENDPYPDHWIELMHAEYHHLTCLDIALKNYKNIDKFTF